MTVALLLIASFVAAWSLTGVARWYALRRQIMDIPNQRSSHTAPTPRGGGVSIVILGLGAVAVAPLTGLLPTGDVIAVAGGGAIVALAGFLDDLADVRARWRFLMHVAGAAWLLIGLGAMPAVPVAPGLELPWGAFAVVVALLATVWLINLYNFMDGIDALAAVQAITVAGPAALMLWFLDAAELAVLSAVIGAAAAGFLIWNRPPARIFMGDAGSGFLGYVFAALALVSHAHGALTLWAWLILLGVFIVDATATLLRRMLSGQAWYQAHSSHAYQHAARLRGSHGRVALATGAINLLWLTPLAAAAAAAPQWGAAVMIIAWLPLALLAWSYRAGKPA